MISSLWEIKTYNLSPMVAGEIGEESAAHNGPIASYPGVSGTIAEDLPVIVGPHPRSARKPPCRMVGSPWRTDPAHCASTASRPCSS